MGILEILKKKSSNNKPNEMLWSPKQLSLTPLFNCGVHGLTKLKEQNKIIINRT